MWTKVTLAALGLALVGPARAEESAGDGSRQMHQHMMKSSSEMRSMHMSGDVDHDFVTMMRQHHQSGIAMAKTELEKGKDPKAREFAQKIVDGQSKEVQELEAWLTEHKAATSK